MGCRGRSIGKAIYEIFRLANHFHREQRRGDDVVGLVLRLSRLANESVQPPDQKMYLSDSEMLRPGLGTHAL